MLDLFPSAFAKNLRLAGAAASLFALLFQSSPSASAENVGELYQGTWQVDSPTDGAFVVLLKAQGLASYFWSDSADRTVYPGNWAAGENSAEITWENGTAMSLQRGSTGFEMTAYDTSGATVYTKSARQLPQEILGQWAKPPTREDKMRSEREQAQGFFGIWKVGNESPKYVFVESDRSAASSEGRDERGQRGQWAKQGSELHIIWDRGEYSILRETERGFTYQQVASGNVIEDDTSALEPAIRTLESKVPTTWMQSYQREREQSTGGIAFSSSKTARAFFRGDWLVRRGDENFERIGLKRFGGLETSADRSLEGQWRLLGQDVFMRWDNGMRKILSPVGQGFVLYEYRPGRPLDGVPTRVLAATPVDLEKFEEHLRGRTEVAEQMRQMAAAAGINPAQQDDAGWGRSFARWVWPFEGDDSQATAEELLTGEYEAEEPADPWWWPFWSEAAETHKSQAPSEADQGGQPRGTPESGTAPTGDKASPSRKNSTRDWLWPF